MKFEAPKLIRRKRPQNPGAWAAVVLMRLVCCSLGLAGLWVIELPAQTNIVKKPASDNRYLLILDTSRGMQRRSEGTLKAVQELLKSSFDGQVQPGDTIGMWTFNDQLHAGQFPLQQWSVENRSAIENRISEFVRTQKYVKNAALDQVIPAIGQVIRNSDLITVILVSDGLSKIHGTIYDEQINQAYDKWREQQRKANMPLVTVLRAKSGKLTYFSVNPAQWPVELPPLPAPTPVVMAKKAPEVTQKKVPASPQPNPPPVATVAPLIIRGKKPEPADPLPGSEDTATNAVGTQGIQPDKANVVASSALATEQSKSARQTSTTESKVGEPVKSNRQDVNNRTTAQTPPSPASDAEISKRAGHQLAQNSANPPTDRPQTVEQSASRSSPAPQVAAAPGLFSGHLGLWIGGLALLGAAGGLFRLATRRRGRSSSPQISLITRSLEKEHRK